jgi:putative transposase
MVALPETIMAEQRRGGHTVTWLTVQIVWVTKYRYTVLKGEIQKRCRALIIQVCDAEDVTILKGAVSKDHVPLHLEYPPSKAVSDLVKRMKGRSSRLLQQEYPEWQKRSWGKHFWVMGYGAWSTGKLTEQLVEEYLEHHRQPSNQERDNFLLE